MCYIKELKTSSYFVTFRDNSPAITRTKLTLVHLVGIEQILKLDGTVSFYLIVQVFYFDGTGLIRWFRFSNQIVQGLLQQYARLPLMKASSTLLPVTYISFASQHFLLQYPGLV